MNLENALSKARELVEKYDEARVNICCLTLIDLGDGDPGGYVATFGFVEGFTRQSNEWFENAEQYPVTAKADTAAEAITQAIKKAEDELEAKKSVCRICAIDILSGVLCVNCYSAINGFPVGISTIIS